MSRTHSELIRNQTLRFLSKALPVLKADDTLPKVTQIQQDDLPDGFAGDYGSNRVDRRMGRSYRDAAAAVVAADELPVILAAKKRSVGTSEPTQSSSSSSGQSAAGPTANTGGIVNAADGGAANADGRVPRKFCDNGGV